ncbi:hypothetical protein AJ88_44790 [Mesorhizobium amorphae CCBAU 01583]|nr:hypothetical protein AJ88_44790 [Mesorhizobium amorphae CCBAU 01583]
MSVTAAAFHFLLGVGAIVNDEVGIFDQAEHRLIEFVRLVLSVCDHRHDAAAPFDPVAYAAARMVKTAGSDHHPFARPKHVSGYEIATVDACLADIEFHRKPRRPHELIDHLPGRHASCKMPGPEPDLDAPVIDRLESRQPDDVIVMAMGEKQVEIGPPDARSAPPAGRRPEPASNISVCLPHRISMQIVLPP